MKRAILSLCEELESKFVSMRRSLHQIPEPSFAEFKTQAKLCSYLREARIPFRSGVAETGVVGLVKGRPGKTIALRSDMDALNVGERSGLRFASRNKGFMHACGHDAHMAMVLGAGLVLKRLGRSLPGTAKLIFQPAEESPPGGARSMIRQGVLKWPKVSAIIGVHVQPSIPVGKVAFNEGAISAAADEFRIAIIGKGGHGSAPQYTVDAIVVAAHFITTLQTIVSRRVNALENVVISIGRIEGGERENVIAETVEMEGTIRTRTSKLRKRVPAMIKRILDSTCSAFGAKGKFEYVEGYPPVICDKGFSDLVKGACSEAFGHRRVIKTSEFEMGGEDFAYYAQKVPGAVIFVGVGNKKKGKVFKLHNSSFDIDEDALKVGVAAIAYSAYRYLSYEKETVHGKGKRSR